MPKIRGVGSVRWDSSTCFTEGAFRRFVDGQLDQLQSEARRQRSRKQSRRGVDYIKRQIDWCTTVRDRRLIPLILRITFDTPVPESPSNFLRSQYGINGYGMGTVRSNGEALQLEVQERHPLFAMLSALAWVTKDEVTFQVDSPDRREVDVVYYVRRPIKKPDQYLESLAAKLAFWATPHV